MADTELSGPHRKFMTLLVAEGLSCAAELPIPPYYSLDIYLRDYHVAVEVDSAYHSKKKDAARDSFMWQNCRIPTKRVNIKDINAEEAALVKEFAESHLDTYLERKAAYTKWLRETNVFT